MEIHSASELGRRLRSRRTAAGRTIASVAMEAGLSVPYIANLENGRGNPTLAAMSSLAQALGTRLRVELLDPAGASEPARSAELPESLVRFARLPRFADEAGLLAVATGQPIDSTRERLLAGLAAVGALPTRPLSELDWHRILDAIVLITRT